MKIRRHIILALLSIAYFNLNAQDFETYVKSHTIYFDFIKMKILPDSVKIISFKEKDQLFKFLKDIQSFRNVECIIINSCELKSIPQEIVNIESLKYLSISNCELTSFKNITDLRNLQYLNLTNNKINIIPRNIEKLSNLQYLELTGNLIQQLPKQLKKLKSLKFLSLDFNQLTYSIYLPSNLSLLSMQYCNLNDIEDFLKYTSIKATLIRLNLTGNNIKVLPKTFEEFKCLQIIELGFNSITSVYCNFNKMPSVKWLDLSNNKLKTEDTYLLRSQTSFIKNVFF